MIISKNVIKILSAPYIDPESVMCFAKSQTASGASDRVILIKNESKLHILFLNVTLSKVIQHIELSLDEITDAKISSNHFSLDIVWSFHNGKRNWRFRILKKIITLGNMQKEFINQLVI